MHTSSGNSRLVQECFQDPTIDPSILVLNSIASAFENNDTLTVWRDVLHQLADKCLARESMQNANNGTNTNQQLPLHQVERRRAQLLLSKLALRHYHSTEASPFQQTPQQQTMCFLAPVLNDIVKWRLSENGYTLSLSPLERRMACHEVILAFLQLVIATCHTPLVLVIDDAVYLDRHSWALIYTINARLQHVLVLLATRPVNKSNLSIFSSSVPLEYLAVLQQSCVHTLVIYKRSEQAMHDMTRECISEYW